MSRRSTSSAGTVSLFPFLAVLVCAMGALILLLLVTTRRIRQRSVGKESIVQPATLPEPAPATPAEQSSAVSRILVEASVPAPADTPILPLLGVDPPPPQLTPYDPTPELLGRLAALERQQASLASEVADAQQQLAKLDAIAARQSQSLSEQSAAVKSQADEKQRLNNLYVRIRQQEQETQARADELRQRIQQARIQLADADSKFAVVPYDGQSGTTRRPIMIECTTDRFTFVSEGVSLKATDLDGFTPRYNPLLYVTQALIRFWERRDRTSTDQDLGEPYLLLVVRPGGTTGYYVARGLLAGLNERFGYELVTDDQEFVWPDGDPQAADICKTIIDKMLKDRDENMEVALRSGATLTEFSDAQGSFHLVEIDRLRSPTRDVTINGQRFSRGSQAFGSSSGRPGHVGEDHSARADRQSSTFGRDVGKDRFGEIARGTDGAQVGTGVNENETPRSVYTRQNSAVTQDDRMPEWLREGTAKLSSPSQHDNGNRSQTSQINPFAELENSPAPYNRTPGTDAPQSPGRSGSFDSSASKAGTPRDPQSQPSPDMLTFPQKGSQTEPSIDPVRPQWGIRSASGTIGFEREVRIVVSPTQVSIGDRNAFQFDDAAPITDVRRQLAAAINREVRAWGSPPKSFYWVPAVRFAVVPGGQAPYERLKTIVRSWDLRESVEYTAN